MVDEKELETHTFDSRIYYKGQNFCFCLQSIVYIHTIWAESLRNGQILWFSMYLRLWVIRMRNDVVHPSWPKYKKRNIFVIGSLSLLGLGKDFSWQNCRNRWLLWISPQVFFCLTLWSSHLRLTICCCDLKKNHDCIRNRI